jgi:hypothetical protein
MCSSNGIGLSTGETSVGFYFVQPLYADVIAFDVDIQIREKLGQVV